MGSAGESWEKLNEAVSALAAGSGGLGERVWDAWLTGLMQLRLRRMPWPDLLKRFDRIEQKISFSSVPIKEMQEEDLREIALEILSLFDAVCRRYALELHARDNNLKRRR